jgi:two-component system nitrogen regulation sensor histidine kinase NtrY
MKWSSPEERKRLFEFIGIVIVTILLVALSRLEGNLFELSRRLAQHQEFLTTIVYFGLININVVLILVLTFLIFRNGVKLVVERRRGLIGSRLRTKLVITLIFFALAPTALMFYVSTRFLTESFETWFSSKVEETMYNTREAGALVYERDKRRIESLARIARQKITVERTRPVLEFGLPLIDTSRLKGFTREYRLYALRVFDRDMNLIWNSPNVSPESVSANTRAFVLESLARFQANRGMTARASVDVDQGRDVVRGIAPVVDPHSGFLLGAVLAEERFETQIIQSVESIMSDFANLKPGAKLIRLSYVVLLILMALIIVFSATWLGFYVSKGIIAPIQSLAEATREVALGNYEITLTPRTDDETGQLVRSFNSMTEDLKAHEHQVRDFTNQLEQTNEELERRRKYMEVILRNISAGVISADAAGLVTSVNRAAERLLGLQAAAVLGRPVREGLGPELWDAFWQPISERVEDHAGFHGQIDLQKAGRSITLLADGIRIQDEHGEELGMVVVFDDASEQVKAQRVAAWREVARRIAHEIKNPITPIKLSAQRLLRKFGKQFSGRDHEVFTACIETIVSEVDSLRDLVNEFSKFSRLPTVKTKPEDLNDIIRDVVNLYSLSYAYIDFDLSGLAPDLPSVELDREQMGRVINNLVSNAISSIPLHERRGSIVIRTELLANYQMVRLEIADNGCGIPEKLKDKVMEPYFSTKKDGTGLGLAIVNQIVSDHGGYLRIMDHSPVGTMMMIELPLESNRRPA